MEVQPQGLYYINSINNEMNELKDKNTIEELDKYKWEYLSKSANSRKVQHYGYKYDYKTYNIYEKTIDLPEIVNTYKKYLTNKCLELNIIDEKYDFNQCIINNYDAGQGISSHIDIKKYGDVIGCFTIGSGATMRFKNDSFELYDIYVEPDSLYIMSNEARYKWRHEMIARKSDNVNGNKIKRSRRISITFRNVSDKNNNTN